MIAENQKTNFNVCGRLIFDRSKPEENKFANLEAMAKMRIRNHPIDKSGAGTLSEKVEVATTWLAAGPGGAFIHQTCCFIAVKGTRDTLHD